MILGLRILFSQSSQSIIQYNFPIKNLNVTIIVENELL